MEFNGNDVQNDQDGTISSSQENEKTEDIKLAHIGKKFINLFGKAFAIKLLLLVCMSKFNLKKIMKSKKELITTPLSISLLSSIFLVIRGIHQESNRHMDITTASPANHRTKFQTYIVYLIAGCLAS